MNHAAVVELSPHAIERIVNHGDLAELSDEQRVTYYNKVCESVGLNPLTKPFEYITLNRKLTLYAKRDATDQLRKVHAVSVEIASRDRLNDVYVVTARATTPDGRRDESIGAVNLGNLRGDALANAIMKAETKAKRRVTLSICGLGFLDETELETIPEVVRPKLVDTQVVAAPDADVPEVLVKAVDTEAEDDSEPYIVPFGKYQGRQLAELDPKAVAGYIRYLENQTRKSGRPLSFLAAQFIERARAYYADREEIRSDEL